MSVFDDLAIKDWLARLATLCEPRKAENLEVILAEYVPKLRRFPMSAFCEAALDEAAVEFDTFPSFKQLHKFVGKWVDAHKPARALIGSSEHDALDHEARVHVDAFLRNRDGTSQTDERFKNLKVALDVMRANKPEVFEHLVRVDDECRDVATAQGWLDRAPIDVTEFGVRDNLDKIAHELQTITHPVGLAMLAMTLGILRKAVTDRAPDLAYLIPPSLDAMRASQETPERTRSAAEQKRILDDIAAREAADKESAFSEALRAQRGYGAAEIPPQQLANLRAQHGPHVPVKLPAPVPPPAPPAPPPVAVPPPANDTIDPEILAMFDVT